MFFFQHLFERFEASHNDLDQKRTSNEFRSYYRTPLKGDIVFTFRLKNWLKLATNSGSRPSAKLPGKFASNKLYRAAARRGRFFAHFHPERIASTVQKAATSAGIYGPAVRFYSKGARRLKSSWPLLTPSAYVTHTVSCREAENYETMNF